jgi:hypothetical protein
MVFAFALALASPTRATTTGAMGVPGGGICNFTFPAGQYLGGFHAGGGAGVDLSVTAGLVASPGTARVRSIVLRASASGAGFLVIDS